MYTSYLKTKLAEIAAITEGIVRIQAQHKDDKGIVNYPSMCGALEAVAAQAGRTATVALKWTVDHVEPAELEAQRFTGIFESIGIELDEETLATLELIGKRTYNDGDQSFCETSPYRNERSQIGNLISKLVSEVQESERDREQDNATDALLKADFEYDEDENAFRRDIELVRIKLTNGRLSIYKWEYDTSDPKGTVASGKSGDFHRLLALIAEEKP